MKCTRYTNVRKQKHIKLHKLKKKKKSPPSCETCFSFSINIESSVRTTTYSCDTAIMSVGYSTMFTTQDTTGGNSKSGETESYSWTRKTSWTNHFINRYNTKGDNTRKISLLKSGSCFSTDFDTDATTQAETL